MNGELEHLKKESLTSALSAALGTAITVLFLETFHIPNSYMALSFASTLSLLPRAPLNHLIARVLALSIGILCSLIVLTAFPEEPWFYVPLLCFIPAVGYGALYKHSGPGSAYAFSAYFLAFHVLNLPYIGKNILLIEALKLWSQTMIPILITYFVALLIREKKGPSLYPKLEFSSLLSIGLTVIIATMIDATTHLDQAARLVMASISTISSLEIEQSTQHFVQRMLGYFSGVVVTVGFIIFTVAFNNNIAIYLLSIGILFGFFEWLASRFINHTLFFRGIAAMLSFSVLMIPHPDTNIHVAYYRIANTLIGFFTAIIVFLVIREFKKLTKRLTASSLKHSLTSDNGLGDPSLST